MRLSFRQPSAERPRAKENSVHWVVNITMILNLNSLDVVYLSGWIEQLRIRDDKLETGLVSVTVLRSRRGMVKPMRGTAMCIFFVQRTWSACVLFVRRHFSRC